MDGQLLMLDANADLKIDFFGMKHSTNYSLQPNFWIGSTENNWKEIQFNSSTSVEKIFENKNNPNKKE